MRWPKSHAEWNAFLLYAISDNRSLHYGSGVFHPIDFFEITDESSRHFTFAGSEPRYQTVVQILILPFTVTVIVPLWLLRNDVTRDVAPQGPWVRLLVLTASAGALLIGLTLFISTLILIWFVVFLTMNLVYIPLLEEPGLAERFGERYRVYKKNVPRWLPRVKPWIE